LSGGRDPPHTVLFSAGRSIFTGWRAKPATSFHRRNRCADSSAIGDSQGHGLWASADRHSSGSFRRTDFCARRLARSPVLGHGNDPFVTVAGVRSLSGLGSGQSLSGRPGTLDSGNNRSGWGFRDHPSRGQPSLSCAGWRKNRSAPSGPVRRLRRRTGSVRAGRPGHRTVPHVPRRGPRRDLADTKYRRPPGKCPAGKPSEGRMSGADRNRRSWSFPAIEPYVAGACVIVIAWHLVARYWLHASTQAGNVPMLAVLVIGGAPFVVKLLYGACKLQFGSDLL